MPMVYRSICMRGIIFFFFFMQKTAYEMRIGDWGSDVCSSDLRWDQLDRPRLRELIESACGRRLAGDYFERTPLLRAYVSEHYRTAVILTDVDGVPYLDKFAVLDDAQGEGLGRAVWQVMREETPRLFWRSRHHNAVNVFYHAEADGCIRQERWRAFWYGLDGFEQIER